MRQTMAIFLDAYRELNSKKLFWISMIISLAVVAALALPTQTTSGINIFGAKLESGPFQLLGSKAISPAAFYKFIYSWIGINLWLGWGATILALISTASMVPDLVSSGSIELTLSKPIGRLRLFLTKYAAGLLFVGLQAGVFAVGAMLVIGLRAGSWDPRPLLVIPIMMMFFSFLHCVSVLVGLVTRSTLMSLLAVVLFWLFVWALQSTENILFDQRTQAEQSYVRLQEQYKAVKSALETVKTQIERAEKNTANSTDAGTDAPAGAPATADAAPAEPPQVANAGTAAAVPPTPPAPPEEARRPRRGGTNAILRRGREMLNAATDQNVESLKRRQRDLESQLASVEAQMPESLETQASLQKWHGRAYLAFTMLPKTGETKSLFQRWVIDKSDWEGFLKVLDDFANDDSGSATQEAMNKRPLWWILGTSFAFEIVILGAACWIFARRDF